MKIVLIVLLTLSLNAECNLSSRNTTAIEMAKICLQREANNIEKQKLRILSDIAKSLEGIWIEKKKEKF
ncbi:MAG: hypothetical protein KAI79_18540 [Bacteroidales bacterium]|nr:hypothetical protein [Bacteroidales bacterium]